MRTSSLLVRSALAVAALLAAAGCGGAGLDYGTTSINTTACTGFTPALYSPTGTAVPPSTSNVIISVTPSTSALAETPTAYQLELVTASGSTTDTLGTLTVVAAPSGAPTSNYTYLSAAIPSADLPLAGSTVWDVTLYNPNSTCSISSFASFTTS